MSSILWYIAVSCLIVGESIGIWVHVYETSAAATITLFIAMTVAVALFEFLLAVSVCLQRKEAKSKRQLK